MTVYKANGEADFLINSLVEKYKDATYILILSSDSDFLAFTDCYAVIQPQAKYRSITFKENVLKKLGNFIVAF